MHGTGTTGPRFALQIGFIFLNFLPFITSLSQLIEGGGTVSFYSLDQHNYMNLPTALEYSITLA